MNMDLLGKRHAHKELPAVTLKWAGGERRFALTLYKLTETERETQCGIFDLLERMRAGRPFAGDVTAVMAQALGAVFPSRDREGIELMDKHVHGRPPAENLLTATAILASALHGLAEQVNG